MPLMGWGGAAPAAVAIAVLALSNPGGTTAQDRAAARSVDWPLHNLDLGGTRYSPLDQINRSNVKTLAPRWLFQHGVIDGVSNQTTPIIVNGQMYVTDSRGSVYAVDAADGHLLWTYDVTAQLGGAAREGYIFRNRGATYADGVVYTAGGSFIFALDAVTGKPMPTFGKNGQGERDSGRAPAALRRRDVGHQHGLLVHDRAADLILSFALPAR